ncbi:MAG: type II and III secretion system protein [Saprospiraceae bacterium]|nr:type II and III secretion system protein [Saprospiraceae bacterium]
MIRPIILSLFLAISCHLVTAQTARMDSLSRRLEALASGGIPLNQPITIAFDGQIRELVAFLAESTKLNMAILPGIDAQVTSVSFNAAPVRDVIVYLCHAHQLDLQFTGSIISFVPYQAPLPPVPPAREIAVALNPDSALLSFNLQGDTLDRVIQKITELTGQNIVLDPGIRFVRVNGYLQGAELNSALKQLAANNNLILRREADFYRLESAFPLLPPGSDPNVPNPAAYSGNRNNGQLRIDRVGPSQLNVQAFNANILDIIQEAAAQLGINYFLLPEGGAQFNSGDRDPRNPYPGNAAANNVPLITLQVQQTDFQGLLNQVFKNTNFDYTEQSGLYVIGRRTAETMRNHTIFQFKNRSVRGVVPMIPPDFLTEVSIDTLPELNSIILSGAQQSIANLEQFFNEIDKLVPVILIEIVLINVEIDKLMDLGVEMGVTPGGAPAGGTIISSTTDKGGVNFSFSPRAINDLLGILAGRNIVNLGRVSPDFYLTLRAVQEDGYINIKSTPKLSTLNSHTATLSIGQSRYYQEQQVAYPGTDRPIPIQANVFREVEANLDIEIKPIVSGDEQVTMEIAFEQSEFIGESVVNAPPPRVSRKFQSMIRVRNGEMVVLGGLEYEATTKVRRGLPFLSRIPLIGWLFGRQKKAKQKDKLLLFVKPTIVN